MRRINFISTKSNAKANKFKMPCMTNVEAALISKYQHSGETKPGWDCFKTLMVCIRERNPQVSLE